MWKQILVFVLAIAGAIFAVRLAFKSTTPPAVPAPLHEPTRNPFEKTLAGAGIVEPASENVMVGVSEPGRVTKVYVTEGQAVKRGDPLFEIDPAAMQAERVTAVAALNSAEADLQRVLAYRRKEDEASLRARVAEAQASQSEALHAIAEAKANVIQSEWAVKDFEARLQRLEITAKANATPEEELDRARYALKMAEAALQGARERVESSTSREAAARAKLDQADAELKTYLAGPWDADVKKSRAAVDQAKASVQRIDMEIVRRTVCAPLDAVVIGRNLREGEYAMANVPAAESAAIVLGNLNPLHVRADIDEFDAQRYKPGMKAVAMLKADNKRQIPLEFVRIEPFIIPKRALTNTQKEMVDTRVLQVVYRVAVPDSGLYVGQQVNVFFDAQ